VGAPDVLARLSALGVWLTREGEAIRAAPRSALTDEARSLIRAHKGELLAALGDKGEGDVLPDPAAEARRQRVLAMLADRPGIRYAVLTDTEADPEAVILTLAIRRALPDGGTVTCELAIPRAKYRPFLLLELVERHGGTVH
jgi:hypothetical protein